MKFRILLGIIFCLSVAVGTNLVVQQAHKYYVKDQTTTNKIGIESPALGASYSMTLPTSNGSSGQFLQNNGSGVLSWQNVPSNYANQSLSNLTSPTAINQDLIPNGTKNLGDSTNKWNDSHIISQILYGSTSGAITLQANATTTPYTLKFPAAQGAATQTLVNDGSGNLSWGAGGGGGGGANQSLSNLTSPTAINQDLIPGGSFFEGLNLGSSTRAFTVNAKNLNVYSTSSPTTLQSISEGNPGANSINISSSSSVGQTFLVSTTGFLQSAFVLWGNISAPGTSTIRLKLYATSGGLPTGTALATSNSNLISSGNFDFTFPTHYELQAGTTYALVFDTSSIASGSIAIYYDGGNLYSGGTKIRDPLNTGSWVIDSTDDLVISYNYSTSFYKTVIGQNSNGMTSDMVFNFPPTNGSTNSILSHDGAGNTTWNSRLTFANGVGTLGIGGQTSGVLSLKAAPVTTSHTLIMPSAQGSASSFLVNDGSGNLSWEKRFSIVNYALDGTPKTIPDGTSYYVATSGASNTIVTLPISSQNKGLKITFAANGGGNSSTLITHQAGDYLFSTNFNTNTFYYRPSSINTRPVTLMSVYNPGAGIWTWDLVGEANYCYSFPTTANTSGAPIYIAPNGSSGNFEISDSTGANIFRNAPTSTSTMTGWLFRVKYALYFNTQNSAAAVSFYLTSVIGPSGANMTPFRYLTVSDSLYTYNFTQATDTNYVTNRALNLSRTITTNFLGITTSDTSWNLSGASLCFYLESPLIE